MGITDDNTRNDLSPPIEHAGTKPRFLERQDAQPVTLGRLRTEDDTRLAAEIEKLRG